MKNLMMRLGLFKFRRPRTLRAQRKLRYGGRGETRYHWRWRDLL